MQLGFIAIYFSAAAYQIGARRRIDVFSVAVGGCCAYFLPGLFGWVIDPTEFRSDDWRLRSVPLDLEWYVVAAIVLASLLVTEVVYDWVYAADVCRHREQKNQQLAKIIESTCSIAASLTLVALVFDIVTAGSAFLSADKSEVLAASSRWTILRNSGCCVAAVFLVGRRNRWALAVVVGVALIDVFIGHRSTAAMLTISCLLFGLRTAQPARLAFKRPKVLAGLATLAAIVILYKAVYVLVKMGDFSAIASLLVSGEIIETAVFHSEPFVTQAILNDTLRYGISVPPAQIPIQVIQTFTLFSPKLGLSTQGFGETAARVFYPGVEWGVASNIWAQMIAAGGMAGLVVFAAVFNGTLWMLAVMIQRGNEFVARTAALTASWWAFYIHRNDIGYILNLEKRRLLCLAACAFVAVVIHWPVLSRQRRPVLPVGLSRTGDAKVCSK